MLELLSAVCLQNVDFLEDVRASAAYRREVTEVLIRRVYLTQRLKCSSRDFLINQ
jgi:CO/xanthine dehydrogenase FAD-binding subunit